MISFTDVTKVYPGGTTAVGGLSLTAPTGRITVLVGPSGCGKTTSLRMINRMIEPTSGVIAIDGRDTATLDANELRRGIGYVIQSGGPRRGGSRSNSSSGWDWPPNSPSATRTSSPGASSSGWGWPGHSPPTRR